MLLGTGDEMDTTHPVLVVDDSQTVRRVVSRHLNALGFNDIDTAEDGQSAIELLSRRKYGLLLSDWEMQPMGGEQLLKAVREMPNYMRLPVILITAKSSRGVSWSAGANGYLSKPFTYDEFKKAIQIVFQNRQVQLSHKDKE
jgi:two-component system, chemotaxis family, chemotaxis protein CheY